MFSTAKTIKNNISGFMDRLTLFYQCCWKRELPIVIGLIVVTGFFVFKDYLFFDKLYIFKDIGSDTYNQLYPFYIHISEYLRSEGIPRWSFNQGMGQNIFPGGLNNPFHIVLFLFGNPKLIYVIPYIEFFKVLLGGIIFYLYLRFIPLTQFAAVVGGLLFAFSGYMIIGSGWYGHSTAVVYGAFLLFSFEKLFKNDEWIFFPFSIALIGSYSAFYLYTFASFLIIYILFRFIDEKGFQPKTLMRLLWRVFALGVLGVLISSVFMLPDILQMIESPRGSGDAGYFNRLRSTPFWALSSPIHYITALLRFYSNDMLGTGSGFRGWYNYLEAPAFYCGTISLLLFPQIISSLDSKRKIYFFSFCSFVILPVIFPYLRYAFYLFAGDYYKGGFSFFVPVVVLLFSQKALSHIDKTLKVNLSLLAVTLVVLLGVLNYPYFHGTDNLVVKELRLISNVFLILYAILIFLLSVAKYRKTAKALILLIICIELAGYSFITLNKRQVMTPDELKAKVGYNDYTVEAVAYLKLIDDDFYRISKNYNSGNAMYQSLNDAQIQGYFGTSSYYSFNQKNYIRFLSETEIIKGNMEFETRWAPGMINRPLLQTLAGIKYNLIKGDWSFYRKIGYKDIAYFGDINVLKNQYNLPLGFTYDQFITIENFRTLTVAQKDLVLFKAFVVDSESGDWTNVFNRLNSQVIKNELKVSEYIQDIQDRRESVLEILEKGQNCIKGRINLKKRKLLFFSIPYDKGWSAAIDGRKVNIKCINMGLMGFSIEKGEHLVELNYRSPYIFSSTVVSTSALLFVLGVVLYRRKKRDC